MMRKNLTQSILRSLGRYIAIVAIIALGCAIFVGLRVTKTDMVLTGQEYADGQNMFDLRLLSSYGWTQKQVDILAALDGIVDAEGSMYVDAFASVGSGDDSVFRFHSVPENVNRPYLLHGSLPRNSDECLVDGVYFDESAIGKQLTISSNNNDTDTLESLTKTTFTIVGVVSSPLYMDMTRGSTSLGSGSISAYVYLPEAAFNLDVYTEIYLTIRGDHTIYAQSYNDILEDWEKQMESLSAPAAQDRLDQLLEEAEREYADGLSQYEEGVAEFEKGKRDVAQQLAQALKELMDGQSELNANFSTLLDGETQLNDAQTQLDEGKATLDAAKLELENGKAEAFAQIAAAYTELMANYKLVTQSLTQVGDGIVQIDAGIAQIDSALPQIEDGLAQIEENLPMLELMISLTQSQIRSTQAALEAAQRIGADSLVQELTAKLEEQTAQLDAYQSQRQLALQTQQELEATRTELTNTRNELVAQRQELVQTQTMLNKSKSAIESGFVELETNQALLENQFASAQAQLNAGYLELQAGQEQLDLKKAELAEGRSMLESAKQQLEQGWEEYYDGKSQAETELADAQSKLWDARQQLLDARKTIDEMQLPEVFVLTRNTNAGYLALDSNSDIVFGIARVLPMFFLLIAALVCITTMTRMVEEERTQIGTLKALGHSNASIMGKYIWYSASAAIIGCTIGIIVGSTFFPILLWNAYGIIFNIRPNIALTVDWGLSLTMSAVYIGVSTLVTWYCCRRTLAEVPATLIRPKSPETGKKIFLEYLPIWKKLSFLNKVMLRNVFRYKQRFLMMLIGIGGCTALLLTGFGLRDTVVDIAEIQFENVNHFDLEVYFSAGQEQQERDAFVQELKDEGISADAGFFYQTSVELEFDSLVRDVYLISAEDGIRDYLSFTWQEQDLGMPGVGEAFLSVGVTEILGIQLGDTIQVRTSDMEVLTLTVAGIYENHVYNYLVVCPQTLQEQWGYAPDVQMAFLMVYSGVDVHEANAIVGTMEGVMNTIVCEDSANMVNSMMDALNLLLSVVIICAGVLGAIVLYNLTNININERIREIATIKVLGFNAGETSAYIFKENILLTFIGVIFGLPLGRVFLSFVMENIKIDMVWFKTRLTFPSYIYAVILTILCALIVDLVFHYRLQKINMAEALKSVE